MSFRTRAIGLGVGAALVIAAPFVAKHEGLILGTYYDPVNVLTACYGHTGPELRPGVRYTKEQCLSMLDADLAIAQRAIGRNVKVKISDKTEAALISFVFNVGEGNLQRSTLLRRLNAGDIRGACNELPKWVYAKGKKLTGLVTRRAQERELCLSGI